MFRSPPMPQSAAEFFSKFARLEHALKALERYRRTRDALVEPDWDSLAREPHIGALFTELRLDPAAQYLIESPPRERVLRAGILEWSDQPSACQNMSDVCLMLRRTRNNLFQGDKESVGSERDERLLLAGLVVMDALIEADAEIQVSYLPVNPIVRRS